MAGKTGKITVGGHWLYENSLNGRSLRHRERIMVTWPDGTREAITVVVDRSTKPSYYMGRAIEIPVAEAYHEIKRHGAKYRVRLVGLMAERVKPARSSRERGTR